MKQIVLQLILFLSMHTGYSQTNYPVSVAIPSRIEAKEGEAFTIKAIFKTESTWYIYVPTGNNAAQGMVETGIIYKLPKEIIRKGKMQLPETKFKGGYEVYEGSKIVISQEFGIGSQAQPGEYIIRTRITYQTCNEKICLPARTDEVEVKVVVGPQSTADSPEPGGRSSEVGGQKPEAGSREKIDSSSFMVTRKDSEELAVKFTALDGRKVDITKLKGKLVLIDCWATWCRPCIAEFANLKRLHANYHKQGLEIIGISMDDKTAKQKVKELISKNKLPWPQGFEGEGFEENCFVKKYGVASLPAVFLVDRNGAIIDSDARGGRLEQLIRENL